MKITGNYYESKRPTTVSTHILLLYNNKSESIPQQLINTSNVSTFKFIEMDAKESFWRSGFINALHGQALINNWHNCTIIEWCGDGGGGEKKNQSKINLICDGFGVPLCATAKNNNIILIMAWGLN